MKIRVFATFRQVVGASAVELPAAPGTPLQAVIDALLERYPALRPKLFDPAGDLYPHVHIFVNGRDACWLPEGLATPVGPDATLSIFPPVGGGRL
jgi:molybdopterin synthase sulfur carrier subunit